MMLARLRSRRIPRFWTGGGGLSGGATDGADSRSWDVVLLRGACVLWAKDSFYRVRLSRRKDEDGRINMPLSASSFKV